MLAAVAVAAFLAFAAQAQAATFTVGTTADTTGTLRESCRPVRVRCASCSTTENALSRQQPGGHDHRPRRVYSLTNGELSDRAEPEHRRRGRTHDRRSSNRPSAANARVFDIHPNGFTPTVTISGLDDVVREGDLNFDQREFGGNIRNEGTLTLSEDLIDLGETTGGSGPASRTSAAR